MRILSPDLEGSGISEVLWQLALAKVPLLNCLGRLEWRWTAPVVAPQAGSIVLTDVAILTAPVAVFYSVGGHRLGREGSATALTVLVVMWLRV